MHINSITDIEHIIDKHFPVDDKGVFMAIFHFHCGKLSRHNVSFSGKPRNFCDKANYILKIPIFCSSTNHIYKRTDTKHEVVYKEVFLPTNAKPEWKDPEVLSNAVEEYEKYDKLGYDCDCAIPIEFDKELQIDVAREQAKYMANLGMCVILSIHDKGDGNPHCHFLCTARSIDKNGEFLIKQKKVYALDINGNKIPVLDKEGNQRKTKRKYLDKDGNEKICYSPQWVRELVYEEPLNDKGLYKKIRSKWAELCNEHLSVEKHISDKSYAEQGISKIPTKHISNVAKAITDRGDYSYKAEHQLSVLIENQEQLLSEQCAALGEEIEKSIQTSFQRLKLSIEEKIKRTFADIKRFFTRFLDDIDRAKWNDEVSPEYCVYSSFEISKQVEVFLKQYDKDYSENYKGEVFDKVYSEIRKGTTKGIRERLEQLRCEENKEEINKLIICLSQTKKTSSGELKMSHSLRI